MSLNSFNEIATVLVFILLLLAIAALRSWNGRNSIVYAARHDLNKMSKAYSIAEKMGYNGLLDADNRATPAQKKVIIAAMNTKD